MKPVEIALLVVAGAIGGALVMKMVPKPKPAIVAQVEQPATTEGSPSAAPAAAAPASSAPAESAATEGSPSRTPAPAEAVPAEPAPAPEPAVTAPVAPQPAPQKSPSRKPAAAARPSPFKPRKQAVKEAAKPQPAKTPMVPPGNPEPVEIGGIEPSAPAVAAAEPAPVAPAPSPAVSPAPAPENATPPAPAPPKVTLNAGMLIPVRLLDGLSTERNVPGDTFTATLYRELVADGYVIAERGARVEGRVVSSDKGGKVSSSAAIAIELTRIHTSDGQTVRIQTDSFERHAQSNHAVDAAKIGGGAAIGAVIGGIAGGGKGAAIGAGVGGGAGAGDVLLTRGRPVTLPSETQVSFRLRAAVTITENR